MVDRHPGLLAKLLTQRTLAAPLPLTKQLKNKRSVQAAGQFGQQLIEERFALGRRPVIGRIAVAMKNQRQLRKQQLGHVIRLRIAAGALLLQLSNHLANLSHTRTADPPVRHPRRPKQTGNMGRPVKVKPQTIRAIDDVLQD